MNEVRIGIVGCGQMGREHACYIEAGEVQGGSLTAVSDAFSKAAERARSAHPHISIFDSPEAMFSSGQVDAVLVTTPHYSHPPLAIEAFNQGLNDFGGG